MNGILALISSVMGVTLLAEAAITWTPLTFYVAMGILHTILILFGYRAMGVDTEHNTFIGALIAAVIINVGAYFLRDGGVIGIMAAGALIFGLLVAVTSGEVGKSFLMCVLVIAAYGALGFFLVPRTPLQIDDLGGFTRVVMTGGMKAEPITEKSAYELMESEKDKLDKKK